LYLSDYFEKNRTHYFDYLQRVQMKDDLQQWIKFFLAGIIETSESSINTFKYIIKLRDEIERVKIPTLGNKAKIEKAIKLIHFLYKNPITTINDINKEIGFETTTANRLIKDFQALEILKEFTGYKRNRMFAFSEYLELFK
jgi:Fic family protein